MEPEQLTSAEYAARQGMFCPFCGESNISVGEIQHDEIQAWIPCKCERCSREWNDIYQLTGYEEEVV